MQNKKEDIVGCEEIAISSPGADYEEQNTKRKEDHNPKENPHREKVGFPNDAKNDQEIGITNEAVCRDEEGTLSDVDNRDLTIRQRRRRRGTFLLPVTYCA